MTNYVSPFTQNIMEKFPSWMKMARDQKSNGAQFLDVFGMSLERFKIELDAIVNDFYIGTARTDMIDILYKIPLATEKIPDFDSFISVNIYEKTNTITTVKHCNTIREFYSYDDFLSPRTFLDRSQGMLYLRVNFEYYPDVNQPFDYVEVNGTKQYDLILHHVWNAFDEIGLLVGLSRLFGETNEKFKERILDVFKNPANSTASGIKNGLARELGLSKSEIQVNYLSDHAFLDTLTNKDGTPTKRLISYAKQINETLKFTYDEMNFGEAYWYSLEQDNLGIYYLPHIWDVDTTVLPDSFFQSGVGADEDLLVHPPIEQENKRTFKAYIGLMGFYENAEELYPEISFRYKIYAKGKVPDKSYKEQPFKYTIEASELVQQPFQIKGEQEFDYNHRIDFFDPNAVTAVESDLDFIKSNDFLHETTDNIMKLTVRMSTTDETKSPNIPELNIIYEDGQGTEKKLAFDTSDKWLNPQNGKDGSPITQVKYADISTDGSSLELGYGAFQQIYDTTADFQTGYYETNSILIKDGKISLNLDTLGYLRN